MAILDPDTVEKERRALVTTQTQNAIFLDRWLLTLSAGVFSLSIVFWKDIIGQKLPRLPGLLIASWSGFCACILTVLASYLIAYRAYSRQIYLLEHHLEDKNALRPCMEAINYVAAVFFSAAVILLAVFSASNLLP